MGNVNWDNVTTSDAAEAAQAKKGSILGTLVFGVLVIIGTAAGGAYVNSVMLGERARDIVVADCPDSTCAVDVRAAHASCFSSSATYGIPSGLGDFQTPPSSPKLGIGTVDIAAYKACVLPNAPKTLADTEQ